MKKQFKLMLGDNMISLKKLPDNSVDSVVTDPPYGLSFMNKKWDHNVPSVEFWKEVFRVLKPGGYVLSFGGTRTYHRMVVNIEDAGFEIRDQIMWIYGSGFPKSLNIGKAVDKKEGNEREVVGNNPNARPNCEGNQPTTMSGKHIWQPVTKGNSQYEGWGTALKPAVEPICVARKPLSEKTVADNVIKWGTGGINIDGCRIATDDKLQKLIHQDNTSSKNLYNSEKRDNGKKIELVDSGDGRFPANIIFECICEEVIKGEKGEVKKRIENTKGSSFGSGTHKTNYNDNSDIHTNPDCPCYQLDEQSGVSKSINQNGYIRKGSSTFVSNYENEETLCPRYGDKGGASRYFYVSKVNKKERNLGLDNFEDSISQLNSGGIGRKISVEKRLEENGENAPSQKNNHPTLKPIKLMSYLIRLVTPENGICLDPFMGSGSTGIAAMLEGKRFVGMEMDEDYFKIAEKRIESWEEYKKIIK